LFTLRAYPRDMVFRERDMPGPNGFRWIACREEVSADQLQPGAPLAMAAAKKALIPEPYQKEFGLIWREGRIIGGIGLGGPAGTQPQTSFTVTKFFDRYEQTVLVGGSGGHGG